tara:strand:+ start:4762 stop:6546 length:1785 start_codon:yes stop_codon:yes gene_type:complete
MLNGAQTETLEDLLDGFEPGMTLSKLNPLVKKWRALVGDGARMRDGKPLKIAVLANHSSQFLCGGLTLALARRAFQAEIFEGGYNQIEMDLLDPQGALRAFRPDIVLISLTTALLALRNAEETPGDLALRFAAIVEKAREALGARIVVTLPEPLEEERHGGVWSASWRRAFNDVLRAELSGSCVLVDMEPLIRRIGSDNWYAGRLYVAQKLCAHPDTTARMAYYLAQHIAAAIARPVRLVAVDLDNTLWGGIVGEVGWQGVDLDAEGKGLAHLKLQKFLLDLHEKGVLLVALSKNNRQDALDVFENRPEMILRPDHFADMRINWDPKSENIRNALADLNLTSRGAAFIDDNPVERAEVRAVYPDIHVPEFPADPIDLVPELVAGGRFLIARSTAEDKNRQEFYRTESKRLQAKTDVGDLSDFYASLELKLRPCGIDAGNVNRVLDLIAKTNQFNLTGARHGASALEEILAADGAMAWAYHLNDKFGGYGLIGVVLGLRDADDDRAVAIETWVLSCRAMGRTVEKGILAHFHREARKRGYERIKGLFVPSKSNHPVADLYDKLGFDCARTDTDGRKSYLLPVAGTSPESPHVDIA